MLEFGQSAPLTLGIELELQLVNRRDFNLTRASSDLLERLRQRPHGFDIKPEITESMIEIATGIHHDTESALTELKAIRSLLVGHADLMNIAISGGGAHPFQHWDDQRIFQADRYRLVSDLYGYLAKQFTVYGQHIHIGCPSGDHAIGLANFLSSYLPDFIALSSASPFYQGVDTQFQSSRLTSVNAFPLSGRMPGFVSWGDFVAFFDQMRSLGIVESMKDFYWDLRPKPEYGTIEIRVCDAPLTVDLAAQLAGYAQSLAAHYFDQFDGVQPEHPDAPKVHSYNRFQACRFGLYGKVVDPESRAIQPIGERILSTIESLMPVARGIGAEWALIALKSRVENVETDADKIRRVFQRTGHLSEVVRQCALDWSGSTY
jgi:carboxylate-amine ligase